MLTLTSLQREAIEKFRHRDYGALFMDMGTGKTRALLELARVNEPDLVLYVCPNTLMAQVEREAAAAGVAVTVASYEAIAQSDRMYLETRAQVVAAKNVTIIADESTALKNLTKTTDRMMDLRKFARRALIATATPITNDELDLYNQLAFLSPNVLKMTRADFIENFYRRVRYRKPGMRRTREFFVFSNVNREYLQKILDQVSLQGRLEMNFEIREGRKFVTPGPAVTARFRPVRDTTMTRLREGTLDDGQALEFLTWANSLFSHDPGKNTRVAEVIGKSHTVCFSMFRQEQADIDAALRKLGANPIVINGDTPTDARVELLDDFAATDDRPLLLTYGVGGRGLNLQHANRAVFSSVTFDWEKMEQARGRIARLGQTSPTLDYQYVLTQSPIVSMILDNLTKKTSVTELVKEILANV